MHICCSLKHSEIKGGKAASSRSDGDDAWDEVLISPVKSSHHQNHSHSNKEKIEVTQIQSRNSALPKLGSKALKSMFRIAVPALMLVFLAACGNSGSESPAANSIQDDSLASFNPCEMLLPAEVESIFGEPAAADAEPTSAGPIRSCGFHNERGGKFFNIQLGPESAIEVDAEDPEVTVVADLGDEAVFFSGMLRVRMGETVLQVSTWHSRSKLDEALMMTQEIARIALTRLP